MRNAEEARDLAIAFKQYWVEVLDRGYCQEYDLETHYREALEEVASWYNGKVRKCPKYDAYMITFTLYGGFYNDEPVDRCKLRVWK